MGTSPMTGTFLHEREALVFIIFAFITGER